GRARWGPRRRSPARCPCSTPRSWASRWRGRGARPTPRSAASRGGRSGRAGWGGPTPAGELLLRERLVERHPERGRVAPGRRDAELLEERGVERAACLSAVA